MYLKRYRTYMPAAPVATHALDSEKLSQNKISLVMPGVHRAAPSVHASLVGVYAA